MLVNTRQGATLPPKRFQDPKLKHAVALILTLLLPFLNFACQVSGSLEVSLDSPVASVESPKQLQDAARAGVPHIVVTAHLDMSSSRKAHDPSGLQALNTAVVRMQKSTLSIVVRLCLAVRSCRAIVCGRIR